MKIVPAEDAQEKVKQEEKERAEKSVIDKKVAFETQRIADYTYCVSGFTLFLFGIAIAQAGLFYWQLRLIREGLADSKRAAEAADESAKATREAVTLSRETAQRQLRAYAGIEGGSAYPESINTMQITVMFKNWGQTPAYQFRCIVRARVAEVSEPPFDDIPIIPVEGTRTSIVGPAGTTTVFQRCDLESEDLERIDFTTSAVFVWGRLDYRDAFEQDRHFIFRCSMNGRPTGPGGLGWALTPDARGYDAN